MDQTTYVPSAEGVSERSHIQLFPTIGPSSHNERIQDGQYYLKRDVVRLWQRVQACSSQSDLERLESQLTFEQRERRKVRPDRSRICREEGCSPLGRRQRRSKFGIRRQIVLGDKSLLRAGLSRITLEIPLDITHLPLDL